MVDLASGRAIRKKIINGLQPSILAASISSLGTVMKNCLIRKVPKADTDAGSIRDQSVLTRPYRDICR